MDTRIRAAFSRTALGAFLVVCAPVAACTANIHDNTIEIKDPTVSFTTNIDADNVKPGDSVPITINAENVYLVPPDQDPPAGHEEDAGYFKIYFDDEDSDPLLVTAEVKVEVKVPSDASEGKHKIICRVVKHDGSPTKGVFEIDITVKISGTTG